MASMFLLFTWACGNTGNTSGVSTLEKEALSSENAPIDVEATVEARLALIAAEATVEARIAQELGITTETPLPPTETPLPPTETPLPTITHTPVPTYTPVPTAIPPTATSTNTDISVYDKVKKSVVRIETEESTGTGFIISSHGLIVTNAHVVGDFSTVAVTLFNGSKINGRVVGAYANEDIALVTIEAVNLQHIDYSKYVPIEIGQPVEAIGFAKAFAGDPTLTKGYVSAIRDDWSIWPGTAKVIQTDTAINPGNSGGPLFDQNGNVIGINTFIWNDTEGLNFAIEINDARPFIDNLVALSKNPLPTLTSIPIATSTPYPTATPTSIEAATIFGPWSGMIGLVEEGTIPSHDTHVWSENTVISGKFTVPADFDISGSQPWTMGFQHRKDAFGYYSVHIRSDQTWQHRHREKIDSKWLGSVLKDSGSLSHINVSGGSTNTIKLISLGEKGWLWINDQYVAELSLEERVEGTIQMSGGFYTGDVKNGYIFEDIRIKSIGTMAVSDPSGSISIDKNSGKSKFWTQGIDSPITNMIIASEITNPLDNWTTGIGLRATEELHHFAIYGGTDTYGTKYALNFHSPDTGWNIIASDYSTTMNRQKGQINKYFIIADEGNGALFINDEFVASLDFSSHLESGAIRIYADLRGAAEESATADFENVQLWHLGE